jgi:N-methylhydantoinase A
MRYVGQNFELSVPIGISVGGKLPTIGQIKTLRSRFFGVHEQYYGFHNEKDPVEVINVRLTASAAITSLKNIVPGKKSSSPPKPIGHRPVWFSGSKPLRSPIYDRTSLLRGQTITGPAIVDQFDSTTVLYPKDRLKVDDAMNLLVVIKQ